MGNLTLVRRPFRSSCRLRLRPVHLVIAVGVTLALAACAGKTPSTATSDSTAAIVRTGKVQRRAVPLTLDAVGVFEPVRSAAVRSQVTGTLLRVAFQEGQDVRPGDLLFEIDPRPFQNAIAVAEADREKIAVQLENARLQVARYAELNRTNMVSQEQYHTIQATERALAAQLLVSESAVASAQLQLEYCSIRAPFAGRTGTLGAHEGDLVRASDANIALVTINQLSPIYVTFGVPQQQISTLSRYRTAGAISVVAAPPGADSAPERGELTFLDNMVDATTGTLKVKATFPNAAHHLWPGQFVPVHVTLASPDVLVVATTAVQDDQDGQHVFVVNADRKTEFRHVTIERVSDTDSVVAGGLAEGEIVVVDGQLRLVPGELVEARDAAAADAPPRPKRQRKAT